MTDDMIVGFDKEPKAAADNESNVDEASSVKKSSNKSTKSKDNFKLPFFKSDEDDEEDSSDFKFKIPFFQKNEKENEKDHKQNHEIEVKFPFINMKGNEIHEKTDAILKLSLGLQNLQLELLQSVQQMHKEVNDINKSFKKDYFDVSGRFDKLEEILASAKIDSKSRRNIYKDKDRESLKSVRNDNEKKKKKKRGRKGIRSAVQENYIAKKIEKPEEITNSIVQVIKINMHFKSCSKDELRQIADTFDSVTFTSGSVITAQAATLDRFYFVESGTVDIIMDGEFVASISPGQTFGDFALLFGSASTSTFRAKDDCKLWYLTREDFRSITSYFRRKRIELKINILRKVKIGEKVLGDILDESELDALALATGTQYYKTGEPIVTEGENGEKFYMIEEGSVDIVKKALGPTPVVTLRSGNFFGERALFSDDVRSASCIAASNVKCLILVRDDFVRMLGNLQDLLEDENKSPNQQYIEPKFQKKAYEIKLSDLDLKDNLGVGSFSTVKLSSLKKDFVKYPELSGKAFALKCSSKELLKENELMNSITNEKNILQELDHPFIVSFYCDFEDESHIYFLLEAVMGVELFNVLCEEIKFPEQRCRFYAASVVLAFGEIHSKKVAYRDLKPENLMLDKQGYLKIVDFGFAKVVRSGKTWTLCGTPDYFAPEVIKNEGHDWAVDYWGLGVLIFEMMTGSCPFSGKTDSQTYQKILAGNIKFPNDINPELKSIICDLCTIDQSKRLGRTKAGVEAIKEKLWFAGFLWDSLLKRELQAPWAPRSSNDSPSISELSLEQGKSPGLGSNAKRNSYMKPGGNNMSKKQAKAAQDGRSSVQFSTSIEMSDCNGEVKKQSLNYLVEESSIKNDDTNRLDQEQTEKSDTVNKMVEFPSTGAPVIRNRRKSYVIGKNRYEQQLADLLKVKKKGVKKLEVPNSLSIHSALVKSPSEKSFKIEGIKKENGRLCLDGSDRLVEETLKSLVDEFCLTNVKEKNFDQFFLLSIKAEMIASNVFDENFGSTYLDPFLCKTVDVLDQYSNYAEDKGSMNEDEISQSCFPSGVKVRLLPRCAVKSAERLGLIGPNSDKYMLHNFTNEDGVSSYGISVTTRVEILSSDMTRLHMMRQRRRAINIIQNSLRNFIKRKYEANVFKNIFRKRSSTCDLRRLSDPGSLKKQLSFKMPRRGSAATAESELIMKSKVKRITSYAKSKARESYKAMLANDKLGEICLIEKCFVIVGIRNEEQSLQLCALKQIVDLERKIIASSTDQVRRPSKREPKRKMSLIIVNPARRPQNAADENEKLKDSRHRALKEFQLKLRLTPEQARVQYPKNEIEHVRRKTPLFEYNPVFEKLKKISLPLPLPRMSGEFGVAKLLLTIKSTGLLSLINLLLIERSILIIGTNPALVTACACALLELLQPFQWASAFMPMIPDYLLDFVGSPVPFIAGACADDEFGLRKIEKDKRVIDAKAGGMSILNLNTKQLHITIEDGIKDVVCNTHGVIHQRLACYEKRLEELCNDETSALNSFHLYFQLGATPKESLAIMSLKRDICFHITGFFKSLSNNPEDWRKYGKFDEVSQAFEFFPSMLVAPLQHYAHLQEMMVHTQLFIGFVENIKNTWSSTNIRTATFIADWLYFRWMMGRKRKAFQYLDSFGLRTWSCKNTGINSGFVGWS